MRSVSGLIGALAIVLAVSCCTSGAGTKQEGSNIVSLTTEVFSIKGNDTLRIDFFEDRSKVAHKGETPVLLYIHGGGFTAGDRVNAAQEIFCRYFAERGWIAASIDYRLAGITYGEDGQVVNPYGVDGTLSAIRYATADAIDATNHILKTRADEINPTKVCLAGGSAGAIAALQLVYDTCNGEDYTLGLPEGFEYAGLISQAGCIATMEDALIWKKSPCPMMLFHGDIDGVVPLSEGKIDCNLFGTLYIEEHLKEMEVPYWKWIEKGADHVMAMKPLTTYLEEQYRFLNDFVVNGIKSTVITEVQDKEPASMASVEEMTRFVPFYILGYGKYLDQIDWGNLDNPTKVVY
ncbi:MAG: alpha/beta hydrolase fold domain-containing protein [Bacteroidales bacterium]|nr:alpha/beta hydrolase fold domain-containing protein [Bacteroidales bacterium]